MGRNSSHTVWLVLLSVGLLGLLQNTACADGLADSMSAQPADVFSALVADTIRGLLEELLVIGLMVVGVGHFAPGRHKPAYYRSSLFRNRIVLLSAVVLFVTYLRITYFVEWENDLVSVLESAKSSFDFSQSNQAAWMVILLTPLDLLAMVCLVGMFLAVAGSEFFGEDKKEGEASSLATEVKQLYLFTGLTHAEFVVSWIAIRSFTGEFSTGWSDIVYHSIFFALHMLGRRSLSTHLKAEATPNHSSWLQVHVFCYASLAVLVYVTRLWWYVALRYTA